MKRPVYGRTLRKLSAPDGSGVRDFYNGTMAKNMVREIKKHNGIVDEQDFRDYRFVFIIFLLFLNNNFYFNDKRIYLI